MTRHFDVLCPISSGGVKWVDETLNSNQICSENKGQNRWLRLGQRSSEEEWILDLLGKAAPEGISREYLIFS